MGKRAVEFFLIPDTQFLVHDDFNQGPTAGAANLDDLKATLAQVCANKDVENTAAVLSLGDMTLFGSSTNNWDRQLEASDILEACDLPFLPVVGNHDTINGGSDCATSPPSDQDWNRYNEYYGPNGSDPMEAQPYFGGRGPPILNNRAPADTLSPAMWIRTRVPGYNAIGVPWCAFAGTDDAERVFGETIAWVASVLDAHPDEVFVVVSHFHGEDYPAVNALNSNSYASLIDNHENAVAFSSGHQILTDMTVVDVPGCVDCFITSAFDYTTNSSSDTNYNVQARIRINPLERTVCYRTLRLAAPTVPPAVEFDFDGSSETCNFLRTFKDERN